MPILNFADFARRRAGPVPAAAALPVTDRWAMLHAVPAAPRANPVASREMAPPLAFVPARDFWGDLLLRLAYPTHRLRRRTQ